jgi:hypothetical protein
MKRLAGLLFLVLASIVSWTQTPDCVSLTQQALKMSGVNEEIDDLAQMFASDEYIRQIAAGKPDQSEFVAVFKPILQKNFDASSLKQDILRRVVARCNPEQMNQAIQEMQTTLVARMLQLEAARFTPEGQEKIKKYMRITQIAPPTDAQMESAVAFDQKVGITDFNVDCMLAVTRRMLNGLGVPAEEIPQLRDQQKQLKSQIQGQLLTSILSTYDGVSKADLAKYGEEVSSGSLKWYYDTVHKSLLEMMGDRAESVGHDLKAVMQAKQTASL